MYQTLPKKFAEGATPQRKSLKNWQTGENFAAYLMMLPSLLPFLLFNLLPIFWIVIISFTSYDGYTFPAWVGLTNYFALLNDASWWVAVRNTFVFGGGKLLIEIPLALILAVMLNQRIFAVTWFRAIIFLPHAVSITVMGIIFVFIFQPYQGILNSLLQSMHILAVPLDYLGQPVSAMLCLICVGVWSSLGLTMILFLAGLQTIPQEVFESAALDGANVAQKFWYITIPLLGPVLRLVIVLSIVFTLRSFDLVKVLTDGGPYGSTEVMFTYIYRYFFETSTQYGYGAALGVASSLIIALLAFGYLWGGRLTRSFFVRH